MRTGYYFIQANDGYELIIIDELGRLNMMGDSGEWGHTRGRVIEIENEIKNLWAYGEADYLGPL